MELIEPTFSRMNIKLFNKGDNKTIYLNNAVCFEHHYL